MTGDSAAKGNQGVVCLTIRPVVALSSSWFGRQRRKKRESWKMDETWLGDFNDEMCRKILFERCVCENFEWRGLDIWGVGMFFMKLPSFVFSCFSVHPKTSTFPESGLGQVFMLRSRRAGAYQGHLRLKISLVVHSGSYHTFFVSSYAFIRTFHCSSTASSPRPQQTPRSSARPRRSAAAAPQPHGPCASCRTASGSPPGAPGSSL